MDFDVMPLTPAGHRFVALAEEHARDFATRSERHDREGSFPVENIEALRRSGASGATVPAELGGLGVDSIHDYVVGVNRLGRGDGSTALAANIHIFRTWFIARAWRVGKLELLLAVDRDGSWRAVSPHWRSRRQYPLHGYLLLEGREKEG